MYKNSVVGDFLKVALVTRPYGLQIGSVTGSGSTSDGGGGLKISAVSGSGGTTANGSAQTETGDDVVELDGDSSQSDSEGAKKDGDSTKVTSRVVFTLKSPIF